MQALHEDGPVVKTSPELHQYLGPTLCGRLARLRGSSCYGLLRSAEVQEAEMANAAPTEKRRECFDEVQARHERSAVPRNHMAL